MCAVAFFTLLSAAAAHAQATPNPRASSVIEVTDEVGRMVAVPQPVRRIVSLAPSVTETLFALGFGDRVVGDTNYCDYPPEAKTKPHIGGPIDPSLEEIAALHPDLVVAARSINRLATVNSLEQLGIAVYATDPRTVEQVLTSAENLGRLIGSGDAAASDTSATLVENLRRRLDAVRARLAGVAPQSVFFVVWQEPLISVGRNTFLADALRWAGAQSVTNTAQDWPNISLETVVQSQPQFLIFSSDDAATAHRQIDALRTQPGWKDLAAVRDNKVILLPEAISHPSPRLVDAIEQLARALYPALFAGTAPRPPFIDATAEAITAVKNASPAAATGWL